MNRRDFARSAFGAALLATGITDALADAPAAAGSHEHMHHEASTGRFAAIADIFSTCAATAAACVGHCQAMLAAGDIKMAACLKTSLACDATCSAVAKLARLDSDFTPDFAKTSIPLMQACIEACKPHIEHHAVCKACYDACGAAVTAAQSI